MSDIHTGSPDKFSFPFDATALPNPVPLVVSEGRLELLDFIERDPIVTLESESCMCGFNEPIDDSLGRCPKKSSLLGRRRCDVPTSLDAPGLPRFLGSGLDGRRYSFDRCEEFGVVR
jgi:hypothetical protein